MAWNVIVRRLLGNRWTTIALVATSAVGVAGISVACSVYFGLLNVSLPTPHPENIVQLAGASAPPDAQDVLTYWGSGHTVESLANYGEGSVNLKLRTETRYARATVVSASFFSLLKISVSIGRNILPVDESPIRQPVVVISDAIWRASFNGDPSTIGSQIQAQGHTYTVIGIMPPDFRFPDQTDLWFPRNATPQSLDTGGLPMPRLMLGRLRDGYSLGAARAEWNGLFLSHQRKRTLGQAEMGDPVVVRRWRDVLIQDFNPTIAACLLATFALWIAVWFNGSIIFIVRSIRQKPEMAVRMALGARRADIFLEMAAEIVVLGVASAVLACLLAWCFLSYLSHRGPEPLTKLLDVRSMYWPAVLCAVASMTLTTAVYALITAFSLADTKAATSMAGVSSASSSRHVMRWLGFLLAAEMALTVLLLSTAQTATAAIMRGSARDLGFVREQSLVFRYNLPASQDKNPIVDKLPIFSERLIDELRSIPGVSYVGEASALPLADETPAYPVAIQGSIGSGFTIGIPTKGDYLQALGARLIAGRFLENSDKSSTESVAVVSRSFEEKFFPGESALGKRITLEGEGTHRIVGLIRDIQFEDGEAGQSPQVYFPQAEKGVFVAQSVVIRFAGKNAAPILASTRIAASRLDPDIPIYNVTTLSGIVSNANSIPNLRGIVTNSLALMALIIAFSTFYSVAALRVLSQRREFSIRLALGATRANLIRSFVASFGIASGLGVMGGGIGSLVLGRVLTHFLLVDKPIGAIPILLTSSSIFILSLILCGTQLYLNLLRISLSGLHAESN